MMYGKIILVASVSILGLSGVAADHHEGNAEQIALAESAAPPAISAHATIKLLDGTVLREGTNSWTCFPSLGDGDGVSAMCGDAAWTAYTDGDPEGNDIEIEATGVAYMLASDPPHLMIIVPEEGGYEGLTTEASDEHAWIMWGERAGRHVMIPIGYNKD